MSCSRFALPPACHACMEVRALKRGRARAKRIVRTLHKKRYGCSPRFAGCCSYRSSDPGRSAENLLAHLPHKRRRVLESRISQPRPLALDDRGRQHGHDVRGEARDAAGHSEEHPRRALVISSPNHFFHLPCHAMPWCQRKQKFRRYLWGWMSNTPRDAATPPDLFPPPEREDKGVFTAEKRKRIGVSLYSAVRWQQELEMPPHQDVAVQQHKASTQGLRHVYSLVFQLANRLKQDPMRHLEPE